MCIYVQAVRTYCTTDLTLRRGFLLKILQIPQLQATTVSSLKQIIGDSHGARINNVLSVNQVSNHPRYPAVTLNIAFIDGWDDMPSYTVNRFLSASVHLFIFIYLLFYLTQTTMIHTVIGSPSIATTTILFLQCRPNSDAQRRLMLARKART